MADALWLLLALPLWYASSLMAPLAAGPLSLVPALGVACGVGGAVAGLVARRRGLLLFLIPFLLSEGFVALAGLLRGVGQGTGQEGGFGLGTRLALAAFGLAQLALLFWLARVNRLAPLALVLLAVFSLTYAAFGAFVGLMAFDDSWL